MLLEFFNNQVGQQRSAVVATEWPRVRLLLYTLRCDSRFGENMNISRSKRRVNGVRVNVYVVEEDVFFSKKEAYAALGFKATRKPRNDRKLDGMQHLSTAEYDTLKRRLDVPKHNSLRALRKASWFSEWDEFVEEEARNLAYMQEACTGIKWDVDHLLPLHAVTVSGLHCADNLQVIPATLNRRKHNKLKYTERLEWLNELKA